ncbi:universal stress protein [Deltaproteobacteria bacterium TL4]
MTKQILVPLDKSGIVDEVVTVADTWGQHLNAQLHFLHIGFSSDYNAQAQTEQLESFVKQRNIKSQFQVDYRIGISYMEIIEVAKQIKPELMVMGAHEHTMLERLFLGSNTKYVLHHSKCPLYIYKQHKQEFNDKQVIVPLDYTEIGEPLIKIADKWAHKTGAVLNFIHVDENPEYIYYNMESSWDQEAHEMSGRLDEIEREAEISDEVKILSRYVEERHVISEYKTFHKVGKPYMKILELQQELNAGLIMLPSHSHTLMARLFMGSNTDYLLHNAVCPMYVYQQESV